MKDRGADIAAARAPATRPSMLGAGSTSPRTTTARTTPPARTKLWRPFATSAGPPSRAKCWRSLAMAAPMAAIPGSRMAATAWAAMATTISRTPTATTSFWPMMAAS